MNAKRLYIDFHVLQTVPPSCVNRDDTGSPKTAVYGGAVRARDAGRARGTLARDRRDADGGAHLGRLGPGRAGALALLG